MKPDLLLPGKLMLYVMERLEANYGTPLIVSHVFCVSVPKPP